MRFTMIRWLFSLPAAMLYGAATAALCADGRTPAGSVGLLPVVVSYLFCSTIALWVVMDAERRKRSLPYDFGSWVFFLWPVVVPVYLFKTRGWRGLLPIGGFILIYVTGSLLGLWLLSWAARQGL